MQDKEQKVIKKEDQYSFCRKHREIDGQKNKEREVIKKKTDIHFIGNICREKKKDRDMGR